MAPSFDNLRDGVGEGEGEWVEVEACSVSVDWAYRRRYLWTETGEKLPHHPRPPCLYQYFADDEGSEEEDESQSTDEDLELNAELIGVVGAEDVVRWYEVAVGITTFELDLGPPTFYSSHPPLFLGELNEDDRAVAHSQWGDLADELVGGILDPGDFTVALDPDYGMSFMGSDTASLSDVSLDSSDSDPLPTTPDADTGMFPDELLHYRSHDGTSSSLSPSKPLNAAATSFVPAYNLDSPSPSPYPHSHSAAEYFDVSAYEFHFPSLTKQTTTNRNESRSVPPPLQRDEYGFYTTEVAPSTSTSATRSSTPRRQLVRATSGPVLLSDSASPAARSRSSSKTRELVDQLRSSTSTPSRRQRKKKGEISSLRHHHSSAEYDDAERAADEADGWIMGIEGIGKSASDKDKQEGWVQGLFQCRSPSRTQTHSKKKGKHERSSSTATTNTNYTTNTPNSTSSLPVPASARSSSKPSPAVYNGTFPPPMQHFMPFAPPQFAAYPRLVPAGMVPMMQLPHQAWHMHASPVAPPVVYPVAMPMFVHRA
ncbi:hypothetical protein BC629DRAFT_1458965 [Irpex lacteus]|nr:hypothetical protein BC629DRAFT_1458965 [Irpex lacteus]